MKNKKSWKKFSGTAMEVVIPEGMTNVETEAFNGCSNLVSVTM